MIIFKNLQLKRENDEVAKMIVTLKTFDILNPNI